MRQSPEELGAHYGPEGPVQAADDWVTAVLDADNLDGVWDRTTPALRRKMAESWVEANRTHPLIQLYKPDELIEALCGDSRDHPLWPAFEQTQIDEFHAGWSVIDSERWGYASRPRPIGLNRELVLLVKGRGREFDGPTLVEGWGFVMEHSEQGWKVADIVSGDELTELTVQG